jgi:predicted helicase
MLLTEGWDCPTVDCVVILKPTKIRSLYVQMVGRGTRLAEGKKDLLLLDFLWLCQKHNLCRPSHLVTNNEEDQVRIAKASDDEEIDLLGAESDAVEARKNALAEAIAKNKKKKGKLVNPLDFFAETRDMELMDYEPIFKWEFDEPTEGQLRALENYGFNTDGITKGLASQIISKVVERSGLATPKQIRLLSNFGYTNVAEWSFDKASKRISMIAAAGWSTYKLPKEYRP